MATYPLILGRMDTYLTILEKSSCPIYPPTHLEGRGDDYPSAYLGDGHPPNDLGGDGYLFIYLRTD